MILNQEQPLATYYELEYKCSVNDIYNMLEIIEGKQLLLEEARKRQEQEMKRNK